MEDGFNREVDYCFGTKDRLSAQVLKITEDYNHMHSQVQSQNLHASSSAPPPDETMVAQEIVEPDETAPSPTVIPDEPANSTVIPPANSSCVKTTTLLSASELKKTKVAENEALKRGKSPDPAGVETVKKLKTVVSATTAPIYVEPLATTPPTVEVTDRRLIPLSKEREGEEIPAASSQQVDEGNDVDTNATPHMVSSPQPQLTAEEAEVEEEEDVDIDNATSPQLHSSVMNFGKKNTQILL